MTYTIDTRPALPSDVLGIQEVFYQGWLYAYPSSAHGVTVEDIQHRYRHRHAPENICKRMQEYANVPLRLTVQVAVHHTRVIGVCRMSHNEERNELEALYVLPRYQRQGYGHVLFVESLAKHNELLPTVVHVASYNNQAIQFYRKLGFRDIRRLIENEKFRLQSGAIIPEIEMVLQPRPTS